MKRKGVIALPKRETATGTTTANHLGVVVGVAAAGGIEKERTNVAALASDLPRYETILPFVLCPV